MLYFYFSVNIIYEIYSILSVEAKDKHTKIKREITSRIKCTMYFNDLFVEMKFVEQFIV